MSEDFRQYADPLKAQHVWRTYSSEVDERQAQAIRDGCTDSATLEIRLFCLAESTRCEQRFPARALLLPQDSYDSDADGEWSNAVKAFEDNREA